MKSCFVGGLRQESRRCFECPALPKVFVKESRRYFRRVLCGDCATKESCRYFRRVLCGDFWTYMKSRFVGAGSENPENPLPRTPPKKSVQNEWLAPVSSEMGGATQAGSGFPRSP